MIRINLLPPEITQRRRDEKRWKWVALGAGVAAILLVAVFGYLLFQVSVMQTEVAGIRQQAEGLSQQSNRFKVFAQKRDELDSRRTVAKEALSGRMDWSRLFSDVALVLPSDLFLIAMRGTQPQPAVPGAVAALGQLTIDGRALDFPTDVPDLGYKSVAKMMVRLAELEQLQSVWMSSSTKPDAAGTGPAQTRAYISFSLTAKIPSTSTPAPGAPGVPAPATP